MKYNTCSNCAYWFRYSNDFAADQNRHGGNGECRRHAPKPIYSMIGDKPGPIWWPQTRDHFWCGDWKERPAADAVDAPVNVLNLSIDELDLSVRAHRGLNNDYCRTIGDVVKRSRGDLLRLPNFGKHSLRDVEDALAQHNLKLSETSRHERYFQP